MTATHEIRIFGDPALKMKCPAVDGIDDNLRQLAKDMIETMYQAPGVGLAAPQVGVLKRMFVYDADDGNGPFTVINPEIVSAEGSWTFEEGCLSVPGLHFPVTRAEVVRMIGINENGERIEIEAHEFAAKILQHEFDHLNGTLLLNRLEPDVRKEAMRQLRERDMRAKDGAGQ